jgi:indolepyruvate ferredoxin oxidoreductase alpha subunit
MPIAEEAGLCDRFYSLERRGHVGVIASGNPSAEAVGICRELNVSLLQIGFINPLPWDILRRFVEGHRLVLIAEEPQPFIEGQLRMSERVFGKYSGHLPHGAVGASQIRQALTLLLNDGEGQDQMQTRHSTEEAAKEGRLMSAGDAGLNEARTRRRSICVGCPFAELYKAISRLDAMVAGDAGCSILTAREPYCAIDMAYGLGSSAGVASGFPGKGIAVMGDYALAHSGLQGVINAVWHGGDLLLILVKNGVAAMTGGQEVPDVAHLLNCLVHDVRDLQMPMEEGLILDILEEELRKPGVSAVVASGRCVSKSPDVGI